MLARRARRPGLRTIEVATDGSAAEVLAACSRRSSDAGAPARRCRRLRPSLDDVFLSLTDRRPVAA